MYINLAAGLSILNNNAALYLRLLDKYADSSSMSELRDAVGSGDSQRAQKLLHSIKGVSAHLALDMVSGLSQSLEARLSAGETIAPDDPEFERLTLAHSETLGIISKLAENPEQISSAAG